MRGRDQQQEHQATEARRRRHRRQPRHARARHPHRDALSRQRQRDHRSPGRRRADRRRLQGPADRHGTAAQRQRPGLGGRVRAASRRARNRSNGQMKTLYEHFAAHDPESPALIWEGETITYGELGKMVDDAYAEIEASNLPADRPIGLRARKSPEAIALVLACLRAERPFILPSVELAPETLARLFAQGGASRVLEPHGPRSQSASLRAIQEPQVAADEPSQWPPAEGADEVSFMLTTSGSTGLPKIVPLPAGGVDRFTDWAAEQFDIGPGAVVANYAPLNFDLCLLDIWSTLSHGGCVALVDQDRATSGAYLAALIRDNEVTVLQAVPMLYRLLIDVGGD